MTFSLVHPSRGRVERAEEAIVEWAAKRSGAHVVEHTLSIDSDDPAADAYVALAARRGVQLVQWPNRTLVEAANTGAARARGDVLIVLSDDFGCPAAWDTTLAALVASRRRAAVLVHDGISGRTMTLPILTRDYYRELGYVYAQEFRSLFADDDLTATAAHDGALIDARHVMFPHRHYSAGLSARDATYARQNMRANWWHGWMLFRERSLMRAGVPPGWRHVLARVRSRLLGCAWIAGNALRRHGAWLVPVSLRPLERRLRAATVRAISGGR